MKPCLKRLSDSLPKTDLALFETFNPEFRREKTILHLSVFGVLKGFVNKPFLICPRNLCDLNIFLLPFNIKVPGSTT